MDSQIKFYHIFYYSVKSLSMDIHTVQETIHRIKKYSMYIGTSITIFNLYSSPKYYKYNSLTKCVAFSLVVNSSENVHWKLITFNSLYFTFVLFLADQWNRLLKFVKNKLADTEPEKNIFHYINYIAEHLSYHWWIYGKSFQLLCYHLAATRVESVQLIILCFPWHTIIYPNHLQVW